MVRRTCDALGIRKREEVEKSVTELGRIGEKTGQVKKKDKIQRLKIAAVKDR